MYAKYAKLRDERGLNDNKVSRATGIATATLTAWKSGKYQPKIDKIMEIAKFLNVPVDYFLSDETEGT